MIVDEMDIGEVVVIKACSWLEDDDKDGNGVRKDTNNTEKMTNDVANAILDRYDGVETSSSSSSSRKDTVIID